MFRHILLPIDGSSVSQSAASLAIGLARACHAKLTSLYVLAPDRAEPLVLTAEGYRTREPDFDVDEKLDHIREAAGKVNVPFADWTVQAGEPWDAILQVSREKGCDLIVMGTHARRGVMHLLLGSETQAVLARSKIPVLVCPPA